MKVGDKVKWVVETHRVGVGVDSVYIRKGQLATISELNASDCVLLLDNGSYFGWTSLNNVEKVQEALSKSWLVEGPQVEGLHSFRSAGACRLAFLISFRLEVPVGSMSLFRFNGQLIAAKQIAGEPLTGYSVNLGRLSYTTGHPAIQHHELEVWNDGAKSPMGRVFPCPDGSLNVQVFEREALQCTVETYSEGFKYILGQ